MSRQKLETKSTVPMNMFSQHEFTSGIGLRWYLSSNMFIFPSFTNADVKQMFKLLNLKTTWQKMNENVKTLNYYGILCGIQCVLHFVFCKMNFYRRNEVFPLEREIRGCIRCVECFHHHLIHQEHRCDYITNSIILNLVCYLSS